MSLKFKTLTIENFKSFWGTHKIQLDKEPGLYYLTGVNKLAPEMGANGVGKTTIWDALTWCLFGATGRDNRPGTAVVPWGLAKEKTSVSLSFSIQGKVYRVTRQRNPNKLTLKRKDDVREIEQADVNKLGLYQPLFRYGIVLAQFGELFLDMGPEQQSRMFTEALNLDVWLKAAALSSKKRKAALEESFGLRDEVSKLAGRLETLEKQYKEAKELGDQFAARRKRDRAKAEERVASLEKAVSQALLQADAGVGKAQATAQTAWKELLALATASLSALERDWAKADAKIGTLARELRQANTAVAEYQSAIEGNQACPTCGQKASTKHLRAKLEEAKEEAKRVAEEQAKHIKLTAKQEDDIKKVRKAIKGISDSVDELRTLQSELRVMDIQGNPQAKLAEKLKDQINDANTSSELASIRLRKLERKVERYSYWEDAFKEIRLKLIDETLAELQMAATTHAEMLGLTDWRIVFQTERVKASGEVSTSFTTYLFPPGMEDPVKWESYSGGESQRWQLAVAFGLSEIVLERMGIRPNLEVLDEPSRGMSTEGIDQLLEHLRERAKELGRAIYVTEHHSLERGLFDGVITIEKTKNGSRIIQ